MFTRARMTHLTFSGGVSIVSALHSSVALGTGIRNLQVRQAIRRTAFLSILPSVMIPRDREAAVPLYVQYSDS